MHFLRLGTTHLGAASALLVFLMLISNGNRAPEASDQLQMHFPRPAKRIWPWLQQIWSSMPSLNLKILLQKLYFGFQGRSKACFKAWKTHLLNAFFKAWKAH